MKDEENLEIDTEETMSNKEAPEAKEAAAPQEDAVAKDGGTDVELPSLEVAMNELQDRYLRLAAEFENYRKRTREELAQSALRAQGRLVASLLDAVDDFQRIHTLDPAIATAASVLEGVALVERKLLQTLEEAGLSMLNPTGEPFDPNTMEALLRVPTDDPEQDDRVDQVLQQGAHFHDLLLRPARVSVRKLDS
jgi:molecular chaperone GrpE